MGVKKMKTISITKAKENLYQIMDDVNKGFNPLTIVNSKGKNAVLISEDEWNNIAETLKLVAIKNNENWTTAQEYKPNEEW